MPSLPAWPHNRRPATITGMDEPPELQHNGHWRMSVWALRVGYLALAIAIAGLIVMLSGSTPWLLVVGVASWLAAAAVTLTGFLLVDAVHAHQRHHPRRLEGPAVLTAGRGSARCGLTGRWRNRSCVSGGRPTGVVPGRVTTVSRSWDLQRLKCPSLKWPRN
jgi:hypothetical protein